MTGVTLVNYSNLSLKKDETLPFTCILKQRKRVSKNSCKVKECITPCKKPMMTIKCSKSQLPSSTIVIQNTKQISQTKPSINNISTSNKNTNTVNTESDSKFSNLNMTYQECKTNSKCLKRSVKKTKSVESCKFPKEDDMNINDNNESKERKNCSTVLNAGRSSFNDSSNCDWTVSSVEISVREPNRACNSTPPVAKTPNCNANCTSISLDQVTSVEPVDQSARQSNDVQQTVSTPPFQSTRTTESGLEPPQEHRRSLGNRDDTNSEWTASGGCTDTVCSSGHRQTLSGKRMSAPEPRDSYGASARGSTSDDIRLEGQSYATKDQNHSCPAAFAEHHPSTPMRPDTLGVSSSDRNASQPQQQQPQHQQQQHQQPQHQQPQHQQQQHQSARPSRDNRSDTAAAWDPDVSSYTAFSDRHMAEDRSRFLTSERTIDDHPVAVLRSRSSSSLSQLLPANDFHAAAAAAAANNENDLSGDSFGAASDWSGEQGIDRCQSCIMKTNRFRNDNNYNSAESLSTLTSSDSSIEMRLAARNQPLGRNVNYARRTDNLSISNNDRYPYDDSVSANISDVSLPDRDRAVDDGWPPAYDLIENVSMPGSLVTGPWSLSMSDSRSDQIEEFGDASAPDDTSCSEGGNASGRDDYDDRPMSHNNNFSGSETEDDGAVAAPLRRRNY